MTEHDITNTTKDSLHADVQRAAGFVLPAAIMPEGAIEAQEAAGQRELLAAGTDDWAKLPCEIRGVTRDELEALGFEFGQPIPGDDLFMRVRLPTGWRIEGTDHSMWTNLLDADGAERAGIFYKAAYYDRSATLTWTPDERRKEPDA